MKNNQSIKARRLELGLTLKEVANALGTSESTISRYESDSIHNMGADKLLRLSQILECCPAYLLGWSESTEKCYIQNDHIPQDLNQRFFTKTELLKLNAYALFLESQRKQKKNRGVISNPQEAKNYLKNQKMIAAFNGQTEFSDDDVMKIIEEIYDE